MVSKSFSPLFLTLGVVAPLAGAFASTACTNKFEGCAASRSCEADSGEGGDGGTGGKGGSAGRGSAGKGGSAGKAGDASMGGEGGEAGASTGNGGTGGKGGSGGMASSQGGSGGATIEPMGGAGGDDTEPEPDNVRPTIVSVSPEDEEKGVVADTVIRITFSEPMERISTEAAYQSADIPSAATTKSWSDDDTVLTIRPNEELPYAAGARNDLSFDALPYFLEMTDTATDRAGNRLEPVEWSFSTLRRFDQILKPTGDDVRRLRNGGNEPCTEGIHLGDNDRNQALGAFLQYRVADMAPGVVEYEEALLRGVRLAGQGKGDPLDIGPAHVREFEEDILATGIDTPVGPDLGIFIKALADYPSVSVLPAMTSSYAADGLLQFRLRMEPDMTNLNGVDDYFLIACGVELRVKYLAP